MKIISDFLDLQIMLACSFKKLRRLDHPGRDENEVRDEESQHLLRK